MKPTHLKIVTPAFHARFSETEMEDPFSLASEMEHRKHLYVGTHCDQSTTIYKIPYVLLTCTDRLRHAISNEDERTHGLTTIIVACITHGMGILSENNDIVDLISVKDSVNSQMEIEDPVILECLMTFFRGFTAAVSVTDTIASGTTRQNIFIPKDLKVEINDLAKSLDIIHYLIMIYAWAATLVSQVEISNAHKKVLTASLDAFFTRVRIQGVIGRVLLQLLQDTETLDILNANGESSTSRIDKRTLKSKSVKQLVVKLRDRKRNDLIKCIFDLVNK